jgi:hypothetical protein
MSDNNGSDLPSEPITFEQLLMATKVLVARGLHEESSNRELLAAAYEFAETAKEMLINSPRRDDVEKWVEWMFELPEGRRSGLWVRYGYESGPEGSVPRRELKFVPYDELPRAIVGKCRNKKEEATRLKEFIGGHPELRVLDIDDPKSLIKRYGIWEKLVPSLSKEEKNFHHKQIRRQNQLNAKGPRKK